MTTYQLFQIDAFTAELFGGNPAAVVPLDTWLPDQTMQLLARENNLAETAFFVPIPGSPDRYHIRWFTPATEVKLCGHATLATAHAIFNCLKTNVSDTLSFQSLSGWLHVQRNGDWLTLDFPADHLQAAELPESVWSAFHLPPREVFMGREDYLLVYPSEADVLALNPDLKALKTVAARGFICTAPGLKSDFTSRCFFPAFGIDEDPVTGSAHTTLTPYWAEKLGKTSLTAIQASERCGFLKCVLAGERVLISGQAILYMEGKFRVPAV
ncbi:MAG: PhzF family phenazine biosynthesis protein [Lewinellaceae bacterium]|nr:PhzF family phenazine biosynthesis protein [Lewinellaceae bacterium]